MSEDLDLDHRLDAALAVARDAGALARRFQAKPSTLAIDAKGPQDWVTAADREVEALIRDRFAAEFPSDGMIGEETGGEVADRVWVVDPIDGTTNFLRGLPEYAVSIAFVAGGRTELGVIYAPALDVMYAARRGGGATANGRAIHVRDTASLAEAVVSVGFDPKQGTTPFLDGLRGLLEGGAAFRRFGAATIGLAAVAAGHVDAFWQIRLNAWDVLAGLLLIEEAGGVTNDFLTGDALRQGNATLASAPRIAEALSRITRIPMRGAGLGG